MVDLCTCVHCGGHCSEEELYTVHDYDGDTLEVCEYCRDRYYSYCDDCGEYYHCDEMTETVGERYVCPSCLKSHYLQCDCCDRWVSAYETYSAIDSSGDEVCICESCRDDCYVCCEDCEALVCDHDVETAYDENGCEHHIGPCCHEHYERCEDCGRLFSSEVLKDGICPACATDTSSKEEIV